MNALILMTTIVATIIVIIITMYVLLVEHSISYLDIYYSNSSHCKVNHYHVFIIIITLKDV